MRFGEDFLITTKIILNAFFVRENLDDFEFVFVPQFFNKRVDEYFYLKIRVLPVLLLALLHHLEQNRILVQFPAVGPIFTELFRQRLVRSRTPVGCDGVRYDTKVVLSPKVPIHSFENFFVFLLHPVRLAWLGLV